MKDKWWEGWGGCVRASEHLCWNTSVLGRAGVNEDQPPLVRLRSSREQSSTIHLTHTHTSPPPGCSLKVHLPNKRLFFHLNVHLILTSFTSLQVAWHLYKKIGIIFFSSQLGKLRHGEVSCLSEVVEAQARRGLSCAGSRQMALSGSGYLESILKNRSPVDLNEGKYIYIERGSSKNHWNSRLYCVTMK